jgi:cold-inducible RNA-binding protein
MASKLYVGGIPFSMRDTEVRDLFIVFGEISDFQLITDRETGRSKGFAFITFASSEDAQKAIAEMNGKNIQGRDIIVNEAKPMEDRPRRSSGGGGGYGGGGAGGGRRNDRRDNSRKRY